ncbi:hypothetical protein JOM56_004677 [Amanita muscaria]
MASESRRTLQGPVRVRSADDDDDSSGLQQDAVTRTAPTAGPLRNAATTTYCPFPDDTSMAAHVKEMEVMPMLLSWTWPVSRGECWIFTDKVVNLWASSEYRRWIDTSVVQTFRHRTGCHKAVHSPSSPRMISAASYFSHASSMSCRALYFMPGLIFRYTMASMAVYVIPSAFLKECKALAKQNSQGPTFSPTDTDFSDLSLHNEYLFRSEVSVSLEVYSEYASSVSSDSPPRSRPPSTIRGSPVPLPS